MLLTCVLVRDGTLNCGVFIGRDGFYDAKGGLARRLARKLERAKYRGCIGTFDLLGIIWQCEAAWAIPNAT